jgi:hypothetical protein
MDVVIQCAATKNPNAGRFRTLDGRAIQFVAQPSLCALTADIVYARPDDLSDVPNLSWRENLIKYVDDSDNQNPFKLQEAYRLYKHPAYSSLVKRVHATAKTASRSPSNLIVTPIRLYLALRLRARITSMPVSARAFLSGRV